MTQWALRGFGPECWGLVSLPLFAMVFFLQHYFARWDQRKREARARTGGEATLESESLRFAWPFSVVQCGLAAVLLAVTFWTRFDGGDASPAWLGVTLSIYSGYFLFLSLFRKQPSLVYVAGALAALAALFGLEPSGGSLSCLLLAGLAVLTGSSACVGQWRGLKEAWRTPLADLSISIAAMIVVMVFSRHMMGPTPYRWHRVGWFDGLALLGSMVAFVACALQ